MLRIAVPEQGHAVRVRRRDAARGRVRDPSRPQGAHRQRPAQRRRVLLPAPARHRDLRRLRRARRRHHRPRPAARLALDGGRGRRARLRRLDLPVRRADRALHRARATSRASGSRRATTALVDRLPRRARASRRPWCASTARSSPRSGSASRMPWPTSSRPARPCAKQGLEIFGPVILESTGRAHRRDAPTCPGSRRCAAACRGSWSPTSTCSWTTTCRPSWSTRPRGSPRASSRRRSRRCATAAGSPCASWCRASRPTTSWTSCTRSAPAPSW